MRVADCLMGSGCVTVARVDDPIATDLRFESNHWEFYNNAVSTLLYRKHGITEKGAWNGELVKNKYF